MKVVMRVKPSMINKIPTQSMRVGNHVVGREKVVYEISKEDVHHLESVGTQHWVEIEPFKRTRKTKDAE
jgi:hypothetical protein